MWVGSWPGPASERMRGKPTTPPLGSTHSSSLWAARKSRVRAKPAAMRSLISGSQWGRRCSAWAATRDPALYETLLAAKEQIFICNSIVDEEIAAQALRRRPHWLPEIKSRIAAGFAVVRDFMAAQRDLEWVEPAGGVVAFPRIRSLDEPGQAPRHIDLDRFYALLRDRYATAVGPGHWFEQPSHYLRIGYGWPSLTDLQAGLTCITQALADARR